MFKRTIAWVWLLHILTTSVGLHVHRIYCMCTGEVAFSLTKEVEHNCDSPSAILPVASRPSNACCKKDKSLPTAAPEKSCCSSSSGISQDATCQMGSDCMDDEIFYLKLKTDLHSEKYEVHSFVHFLPADLHPQVFLYPERRFTQEQKVPACFRGPPLKPYGRYLLPYVQTWLC